MPGKTISDIGEKELIRSIIRPRFNPNSKPDMSGDDCAIIRIAGDRCVCLSTDRVPADLISFRLGILDYEGLGHYLAVLNLSDIAAMGAEPAGLLLNLGLPADLSVRNFEQLLDGAARACQEHRCEIIGGDLSTAAELSISATSVGIAEYSKLLRRMGCTRDDQVYCTGILGLTATAFEYFLTAKPQGMRLTANDEQLLSSQFTNPRPRFEEARVLRELGGRVTAMDNTDGAGQTLSEICEFSSAGALLDEASLPIHDVSRAVARYLGKSALDIVLGPGADFNLIGTMSAAASSLVAAGSDIHIIGRVTDQSGIFISRPDGVTALTIRGWNYYLPETTKIIQRS